MIDIWNGKIAGYKKEYDNEHNLNKPVLEECVIKDGKKHSCFLILPGGGYDHLSNHEGENVAKRLNEMGISAFVLYYRVAPYMHPTYLWDVKRAIRYIKHNAEKYNIDTEHIGIMGFSAGGHLACMATQHFDKFEYEKIDELDDIKANVNALCMCYPVVSITKEIRHDRTAINLTSGDKELLESLSCELNVREDMPPTFLWHTFEDKSVDCRNSLEMGMALKEKNIPFELHIFPEGKHGLDIAENIKGAEKWTELFEIWISRFGFI